MDDKGVSEIIGTLLLLLITVALFSVVLVWAMRLPTPEAVPYVDLRPYLNDGGDGWGNGNERVVIEHRGGEPIFANHTRIQMSIDGRELVAEREDLNFPNDYMYMGDTWIGDRQRVNSNSTVILSVYYVGESTISAIMPEQRLTPRLRSPARADLTIYADEVSYVPPVVIGQDVVINANVRNTGRGDATPFTIALYEGTVEEGRVVNTIEVKSIKGQSSSRVQIIYPDIPFDPTKMKATVTILLDYMNAIPESNERNNALSLEISASGGASISLIENFEYGAPGWEHGGKQDEWELGGPVGWNGPAWYMHPDAAHWGSTCWGTDLDNTYNSNADFWLVSPEVALINATEAEIDFYYWYNFETEWDFGRLEITTDGGKTWTAIKNYTGSSDGWMHEEIDLSGYIGNVITVRFHVVTDSYGNAAGWYIDDVTILGKIRRT
ncbi:MAG: type IV pilin [Candidatus Thermoplasmatota archaeon]|nr:type IV pilin [Candidatus Thermoplasmatota archaeon]